jgi:hypothetical protein
MHKVKLTRAMKRELNEERIPIIDLLKVKKHFFKDLDKSLNDVIDPRHASYTVYRPVDLLMTSLLGNLMTIKTVTGVTESFNNDDSIENFRRIVKNSELTEMPHHDTINNFLKELDSDELLKVRTGMIKDLLKKRSFEQYRLENNKQKYWLVGVDATGTHSFNKRHCEHCLTRKHVDKETGKETFSYYHNVLESKLILGEFVFSIGTEFIENEDEFVSKQDCERNAFKRLAKRLKKDFSRLPICILADSLYANGPVMDICKSNRWEYIIRFKSGSIKTLSKEFEDIKNLENKSVVVEDHKNKIYRKYAYVNNLDYKVHSISVAELEETKIEIKAEKEVRKVTTFKYISSIRLSNKTVIEAVATGRMRWKIENEGFNVQKNHGYEIHHLKSTNVNAMKNHYLLIQIAHIIRQIYDRGVKVLRKLKLSIKKESKHLLASFRGQLTDKDLQEIETCKIQVRFL